MKSDNPKTEEDTFCELRTYACLTSSSFRGPEVFNPRASLSETIADSEPSDSDEES